MDIKYTDVKYQFSVDHTRYRKHEKFTKVIIYRKRIYLGKGHSMDMIRIIDIHFAIHFEVTNH